MTDYARKEMSHFQNSIMNGNPQACMTLEQPSIPDVVGK